MVRVYSTVQQYCVEGSLEHSFGAPHFSKDTTGRVMDIFFGPRRSGKTLAVDKHSTEAQKLYDFDMTFDDGEDCTRLMHTFLTRRRLTDHIVHVTSLLEPRALLVDAIRHFEAAVQTHPWASKLPDLELRFWIFPDPGPTMEELGLEENARLGPFKTGTGATSTQEGIDELTSFVNSARKRSAEEKRRA